MLNLNIMLRADLHAMIKRASPDELSHALHAPQSPIRDRFIRFLALSYADWLATQADLDEELIKADWRRALAMKPATGGVAMSNGGVTSPQGDGKEGEGEPQRKHQPLKRRDTGLPGHPGSVGAKGAHPPLLNGTRLNERDITLNGTESPVEKLYGELNGHTKGKEGPRTIREKRPFENFLHLTDREAPPAVKLSTTQPRFMAGEEFDDTASGVREMFESLHPDQRTLIKTKMPQLTEITSPDKRAEVLIKKLQLCCTQFNFHTTNVMELKGIEKKKQNLTEILEYIARCPWYSEEVLQQCIATISKNLFRALPRRKKNPEVEEEPFEDPAWPHLQLVYDLTLRLVICTDVDKKIMRRYLEGTFVDNIIELFASDDAREREYLKTILHRIYGRFMPLRQLIRVSIANCCYRTIYHQTRPENGIAEFLEIFCSIIHGFSVPVKREHKEFLRNVLVPLHKCRRLEKFHEQLVACCVQFVFKDPAVAPVILGGLLKFWPIQSPTKEEMFIAEVVNLINAMINHRNGFSWPKNREIALALIDRLVKCMKSKHHSVAERALLVWSEDAVEILVDCEKKTTWPKIVGAFMDNKEHWNESLRECNEDAMDGFRVRDHSTFHRIREEYLSEKKQSKMDNTRKKGERRRDAWRSINRQKRQALHQQHVSLQHQHQQAMHQHHGQHVGYKSARSPRSPKVHKSRSPRNANRGYG